ncbi:MAG: hypothetical protein V4662_17800 [Verrucomicrobiota bacterium]
MPLIRLAVEAAPGKPAKERAELFDALALITKGVDADLHGHASAAAETLRAAEGHQMTFRVMMDQSTAQMEVEA